VDVRIMVARCTHDRPMGRQRDRWSTLGNPATAGDTGDREVDCDVDAVVSAG